MAKQLYWEDVKEGDEVTPLSKVGTTRMLVKYAGAAGDFNPLHYEDTFAESQGTGKPIIHGQLKRAWLIQLLTDWIGEEGFIKKFSCRFRAMDHPRLMVGTADCQEEGETWWCKGKVTKKYVENGEHYLDCNIGVENGQGEVTTPGTATIILPSKG